MRALLLSALAAPLVLTGCAGVSPAPGVQPYAPGVTFDTYDADGDGFVTDAEFGPGFGATPYYRGYDRDGDGLLDENEFTTGTSAFGYRYNDFDRDGDGYVADVEYTGGVYRAFDRDADGVLDRNEFESGFQVYADL